MTNINKPKTKGLFDIPLPNTQIYGTQSVKALEQFQKQFSQSTSTQMYLRTSKKASEKLCN